MSAHASAAALRLLWRPWCPPSLLTLSLCVRGHAALAFGRFEQQQRKKNTTNSRLKTGSGLENATPLRFLALLQLSLCAAGKKHHPVNEGGGLVCTRRRRCVIVKMEKRTRTGTGLRPCPQQKTKNRSLALSLVGGGSRFSRARWRGACGGRVVKGSTRPDGTEPF